MIFERELEKDLIIKPTKTARERKSSKAHSCDVFRGLYDQPELLSLLMENLDYCSDLDTALCAVADGDEKTLLNTICPDASR